MDDLMNQMLDKKIALAAPEGEHRMNSSIANLAVQRFSMLFTIAIVLMLLLTMGLAYMSGGGYVDIFLTSAIVIILIAIVLKVMFTQAETSVESKHE